MPNRFCGRWTLLNRLCYLRLRPQTIGQQKGEKSQHKMHGTKAVRLVDLKCTTKIYQTWVRNGMSHVSAKNESISQHICFGIIGIYLQSTVLTSSFVQHVWCFKLGVVRWGFAEKKSIIFGDAFTVANPVKCQGEKVKLSKYPQCQKVWSNTKNII